MADRRMLGMPGPLPIWGRRTAQGQALLLFFPLLGLLHILQLSFPLDTSLNCARMCDCERR
jgi:hypothetical protein